MLWVVRSEPVVNNNNNNSIIIILMKHKNESYFYHRIFHRLFLRGISHNSRSILGVGSGRSHF